MQTPHQTKTLKKNPKKPERETRREKSVQQVMHRQNHRNQINRTPITQPKNKQKILRMSKGLPCKSIMLCSGTLHTMFWMKITMHKRTCFGWRSLCTEHVRFGWRSLCTKQHVLDENHSAQTNMFWMKITLHKTTCFGWKSLWTKHHVLDEDQKYFVTSCFGWRSLYTKQQHVLDEDLVKM
jgi:hypothetical protein